MRSVRVLAAVLGVIIGAYLFLKAYGIRVEMLDQAEGWYFFPLPSHPNVRIVAYLVLAIVLQFGSAWLLTLNERGNDSKPFGVAYAARVVLLLAAGLAVAFLMAFTLIALLDAGVI